MSSITCIIESGALKQIAREAQRLGATKAFLVGDTNTFDLAGDEIACALAACGMESTPFIFKDTHLAPDAQAMGTLFLRYDNTCDLIIGIGSGVINDVCKLLAHHTNNPYIIVATAPSMDGYASPLSSMILDSLKVSISSKHAEVLIADLDILMRAPMHMIQAGPGDMLAKYTSICEWRLGHLITGEFYDEAIADSVRQAVRQCVQNAAGLLRREPTAIKAVMEGLVLTGEAMKKAGVSRPASGAEHYFSHLWEMRGLEFHTPTDLHGIECAVATRLCVNLYWHLTEITPDEARAREYAEHFSQCAWNDSLRAFLGKAAEPMITLETTEGKYNKEKHKTRLDIILKHWHESVRTIQEELPTREEFDALFSLLHLPMTPLELGHSPDTVAMTVKAGKDIRDKYVLPRLLWDFGILDDFCKIEF